MEDNFKIIAITSPVFFPREAERINKILSDDEVSLVHIRKPNSSIFEIEKLISQIHPNFYSKLKLHDHFELLDKYDLGGVHMNSRNPKSHPKAKETSISIHSLDEISGVKEFDYYFISPIFNSISKRGYKAQFDLNVLSQKINGTRAIALGGVTPDKYSFLKSMGFIGGALLGYFFPQK